MKPRPVNNRFYEDLGDRWYSDDRHAIALLRAESVVRVEYIVSRTTEGERVADIGAGAGFLSLPLYEQGRAVVLLDLSRGSLIAARRQAGMQDAPPAVQGDAFALPFPGAHFDTVLLMDVLEHVQDPGSMIREAGRILRPGGKLFFHTFNRTLPARLLAVHGMRLLMPECPEDLHVYEYFITPAELAAHCARAGLEVRDVTGVRPRLFTFAALRSLLTRRLDPGFSFTRTRSTAVGYMGFAVKGADPSPMTGAEAMARSVPARQSAVPAR